MEKFGVQLALEAVREAKQQWTKAQREFNDGVNRVMARLIHEAARNFMSPQEVARHSGLSTSQVKRLMLIHGLTPGSGKRMLSDKAAKALNENAALLGVRPHEVDLTSPLAYLPMGNDLRTKLQDQTNAPVTEFPETVDVSTLPVEVFNEVAAIIAEETACGHCNGECDECQAVANRIVGLVMGMSK